MKLKNLLRIILVIITFPLRLVYNIISHSNWKDLK